MYNTKSNLHVIQSAIMPKICIQNYTFLFIMFMTLAKYSVYKRPLKVFYRLCALQEIEFFFNPKLCQEE